MGHRSFCDTIVAVGSMPAGVEPLLNPTFAFMLGRMLA